MLIICSSTKEILIWALSHETIFGLVWCLNTCSYGVPDWTLIEVLVRDYGIVCISRPQSNPAKIVFESEILSKYESNILLITDWCQNALSATLVRRALSLGETVRYLVPDGVLDKIYDLGLYNAKRPPRYSVHRSQIAGESQFDEQQ
ncbi:unnamed protein product [Echinostoma caproni]|uniref:Response regulator n=1 Tax=Echinostoma caproni TaxID=27848 RepID=A0A182ZZG4_9TREM|nr:unnamed protein product [Echinostoma caproni]